MLYLKGKSNLMLSAVIEKQATNVYLRILIISLFFCPLLITSNICDAALIGQENVLVLPVKFANTDPSLPLDTNVLKTMAVQCMERREKWEV